MIKLKISREEGEYWEGTHAGFKELARWYHIKVTNLELSVAQDCCVFLDRIYDVTHKQDLTPFYPPVGNQS